MNKLKTVFRYIRKIDFKNMRKIVSKISRKCGKAKIVIFFDMVYCAFVYGSGYYDYQEWEFYALKNRERKTYLTRAKNNLIIKTYNQKEAMNKFDNKEIFNKLFKSYLKRAYLIINDDSYQAFTKFIKKFPVFIAKPIDGTGGKDVEKIVINKTTKPKEIFQKLLKKKQLLLEEFVKQHQDIDKLYLNAVNTLRLYTFFDGKKTHILNSVFKIGNGGVTDNFSSGSMYTFVDEEGIVIYPAIDQNDNVYAIHPLSKKAIVGFSVPLYDEAVAMVKKASRVIPEIKYVGWDVAISQTGPVIIEGNCFPGVHQIKPSLTTNPVGLIPKYQKFINIK